MFQREKEFIEHQVMKVIFSNFLLFNKILYFLKKKENLFGIHTHYYSSFKIF